MIRRLLAAMVVVLPTTAHAEREPTPEERTRIEAALRSEGFTRWDEIELDGDGWEVEDAVAADGKTYELKLNKDTFAIIERDGDAAANTGSVRR